MNNSLARKFITFEGGEGCGKSTQSKILYEYLLSKNTPVVLTREIGGSLVAEKMREILVHQEMLPMSELLLIMAARYDHIQQKILPMLQKGYTVICDRFIDSTACYQGDNIEIGINLVYDLHQMLMLNLLPDITFFIDIAPEIAIKRLNLRTNNNKFDVRNLDFHQKIYNSFQKLSEQFSKRIIRVEGGNLDTEQIHKIIKTYLL